MSNKLNNIIYANRQYYCDIESYHAMFMHNCYSNLGSGCSYGSGAIESMVWEYVRTNVTEIIQIRCTDVVFTLVPCPEYLRNNDYARKQYPLISNGFEILDCTEKIMMKGFFKEIEIKLEYAEEQIPKLQNERDHLKQELENVLKELKDTKKYLKDETERLYECGNYIEIKLEYAEEQISKLQNERDNLKQELKNVLALDNAFYSNQLFAKDQLLDVEKCSIATQTDEDRYISHVEVIPIYDYALIKKERDLLHFEFKTAFKFFKRLVQLRYETPVALAVLVSK